MSNARKRIHTPSSEYLAGQSSRQSHLRTTLASNRLSTSSSYVDRGDYFWSQLLPRLLIWNCSSKGIAMKSKVLQGTLIERALPCSLEDLYKGTTKKMKITRDATDAIRPSY